MVTNHLRVGLKMWFLCGVAIVLYFDISAQNDTGVGARYTEYLDGKWQVIIDWYSNGRTTEITANKSAEGKYKFVEFSFDNSQTLAVPGDWNSQRKELLYYEGTVWYKRNFQYSPVAGRRTYLHFEAVNYRCEVYLNGNKLGEHEGGFTPFEFDATKMLKKGENLLVLRVNNERTESNIPARKFDWWNYGGITRSVKLITLPDQHIKDYFIQLKKGTLDVVEGWVKLNGQKCSRITLEIPEVKFKKNIECDSTGKALISTRIKVQLWSPENPKLYAIMLYTGKDTLTDYIGFRSIEVKGTKILLNRRPVFLRGISFHEEMPQRAGRAYSEADIRTLLTWAKELGCNFIRLAHYPQNEQTVKLSEQMGFMVWEEIPLWQGIQFGNPHILNKAKLMLHEMISRDKNRCGIIIWSLSNETTPGALRNATLTQMAKEARAKDPTRLISSAFDHFRYDGNQILIDDSLSESLDVLAANKYMGWYARWPAEPGNVIWKSNFNKPLIISEFGGEALFGNHGSKDTASLWTEEYQEQLYKDNISMFKKISFLGGVCPWVLADFRSPFRMHAQFQEGWNRKGLLSDKGFKKKAWFVMKSYYDQMKNSTTSTN